MTPQERRGKRLFMVLATPIILEKVAGIGNYTVRRTGRD